MRWLRPLAMALIVSAAALALVESAFAVPADSIHEEAPRAIGSPGPVLGVDAGRRVYATRCAICHGADGTGSPNGPSLAGVGAAAVDFELRTGRMPFSGAPGTQAVRKPPAFDEITIRDLIAYISLIGAGPAIPAVRVDPASVSSGQRLFIGNCAPCHGATANGGAVGGGALAPPLDQATPVEVAEAMLIGPGQMPIFSGLEDADRNAIVSYVAFLQSAAHPGGFSIGGIGPVPEGLVSWVVGLGLLMVIVVLIARDWRRDPR
jgi:ubiquinol-cytochrome c reductase cytochrome c subunit